MEQVPGVGEVPKSQWGQTESQRDLDASLDIVVKELAKYRVSVPQEILEAISVHRKRQEEGVISFLLNSLRQLLYDIQDYEQKGMPVFRIQSVIKKIFDVYKPLMLGNLNVLSQIDTIEKEAKTLHDKALNQSVQDREISNKKLLDRIKPKVDSLPKDQVENFLGELERIDLREKGAGDLLRGLEKRIGQAWIRQQQQAYRDMFKQVDTQNTSTMPENKPEDSSIKRRAYIAKLLEKIDSLPQPKAGPLRIELNKVSTDGTERQFKKAIHGIEKALGM